MATATELMATLLDPDEMASLRDMAAGEIASTTAMEALLKLMHERYLPALLKSAASMPDATRKDLLDRVHKMMASLTEAVHRSKGRTVLYIPPLPAASTAADKDALHQAESILLHWTRQIKEVIYSSESVDGRRSQTGPLDEIAFWRSRSEDLSALREQLGSDDIGAALKLLEQAKSAYLPNFLSLRHSIQREAISAEDNLKFLLCLEKPCEQLAKATPVEIPPLLPLIANSIRLIWNFSRFYNTEERVGGLLMKVANEISHRCRAYINKEAVFSGDVVEVRVALDESIEASRQWKAVYTRVAGRMEGSPRPWEFDPDCLFSNTDAFIQRCVDLQEVCQAQSQFAPNAPTPIFSGLRGPQIKKNLAEIYQKFTGLVTQLRDVGYNVLDVQQIQWLDDFTQFKAGVKDLEMMFSNVLNYAYDGVSALKEKLTVLTTFVSMCITDVIHRALSRKISDFYGLFKGEVQHVKHEFDDLRRHPISDPTLPQCAGTARSIPFPRNRAAK